MQPLSIDDLLIIREALNARIQALIVAGMNGNPANINEATRTATARDLIQKEIDQRQKLANG